MILGSSSLAANNKFKVKGDTLFYSTEGQFVSEKGIEYEDISMFRKLLSENPMVENHLREELQSVLKGEAADAKNLTDLPS